MPVSIRYSGELLTTLVTAVGGRFFLILALSFGMVLISIRFRSEYLTAERAGEGPNLLNLLLFANSPHEVLISVPPLRECLTAEGAGEGPLLRVQSQVVLHVAHLRKLLRTGVAAQLLTYSLCLHVIELERLEALCLGYLT